MTRIDLETYKKAKTLFEEARNFRHKELKKLEECEELLGIDTDEDPNNFIFDACYNVDKTFDEALSCQGIEVCSKKAMA